MVGKAQNNDFFQFFDNQEKLTCVGEDSTYFCAIGDNESFLTATVIALEGILLQYYQESTPTQQEAMKNLKPNQVKEFHPIIKLTLENMQLTLFYTSKYSQFGEIETSMLSELLYSSEGQRMVLTRNYKVVNTEFYWDQSFQENRQYHHFKFKYLTQSLAKAGFQMGVSINT